MKIESKLHILHDADTNRDIKCSKVLLKYGYEGMGLFWAIIEAIYINNDAVDYETILYLALCGKMKNERLDEMLKFMVNIGLLYVTDDKHYSSKRAERDIQDLKKKQQAFKDRWKKRRDNKITSSSCHDDMSMISSQYENDNTVILSKNDDDIREKSPSSDDNLTSSVSVSVSVSDSVSKKESGKEKKSPQNDVAQKPTNPPPQNTNEISKLPIGPTSIALKDGQFYTLPPNLQDDYAKVYSHIDVEAELIKIATWSYENLDKRKTELTVRSFVVRWLGEEDNKAKIKAETATSLQSKPSSPRGFGVMLGEDCKMDFQVQTFHVEPPKEAVGV